jgi:hypothetical protein
MPRGGGRRASYFEDEDSHSIEIRSHDGGPGAEKRPESPEAAMI